MKFQKVSYKIRNIFIKIFYGKYQNIFRSNCVYIIFKAYKNIWAFTIENFYEYVIYILRESIWSFYCDYNLITCLSKTILQTLQCRVYRSRNDGNYETPLNLLYFLLVTVERSWFLCSRGGSELVSSSSSPFDVDKKGGPAASLRIANFRQVFVREIQPTVFTVYKVALEDRVDSWEERGEESRIRAPR